MTCEITSPKLNCSAVTIKSNETGENTLNNLRMTILLQQWDQEKNHTSQDQDHPSQLKMHLSCAGTTILILSATVIGIKILITIAKYASKKARNDIRITLTPSAPYDPQISDT